MIEPTAQDYIDALERQRNDALNSAANLAAQLAAAERRVAELEAQLCGESR